MECVPEVQSGHRRRACCRFIGRFSASPCYYDASAGKTGTALRQSLHTIIRNHTVIPYSSSSFDTSDALKILDEDPTNTNNVILLYAARSEPKATFGRGDGTGSTCSRTA